MQQDFINADIMGNILLHAARLGNINHINIALAEGAPVDSQDKYGMSALMFAARNGDVAVVDLLLMNGADIYLDHSRDHSGATALLFARNYSVAKKLLLHLIEGDASRAVSEINRMGQDINTLRNKKENTLLMFAIRRNKKKLFNILLQTDHLDLETRCLSNATALIHAVDKNRPGMMKSLIQKGANVNAASKGGITGLMRAAARGYMSALEILIEHKANINTQSDTGLTAYMFACRNGVLSNDSAKFLLQSAANRGLKDTQGKDGMPDADAEVIEESFAGLKR